MFLLAIAQISYQAISTHDPSFDVAMESAHIQRLFPDTSVLLQQLKPGTTFDVSVCAETSVGCGSYRNLTVTTDIAREFEKTVIKIVVVTFGILEIAI